MDMESVSLNEAARVIEAARRHAEGMGVAMNVAVVGAGCNLAVGAPGATKATGMIQEGFVARVERVARNPGSGVSAA